MKVNRNIYVLLTPVILIASAVLLLIVSAREPLIDADLLPIKVEVFLNFSCENCAEIYNTTLTLSREFGDEVEFDYMFPDTSSIEFITASAYFGARRQDKGEEFLSSVFDTNENLTDNLILTIAKELNLDIQEFDRVRNSEAIYKRLNEDLAQYEARGFNSLPKLLINNQLIENYSEANLREILLKAIASANNG